MNWYKRAQFEQLSEDEENPPPESYNDIGHYGEVKPENPDCEEYLWVWKGGELAYEEGMAPKTHWDIWPAELLETTYSGRYDECTNQISIGIPRRGMAVYRDVPSALVSILKRKFSPSAQVYTFREQTPEYPNGIERVASSI